MGQCSDEFTGSKGRIHSLSNPSPVKGEGLSVLLDGRLKANGTVAI
jgi:hypothetical protein